MAHILAFAQSEALTQAQTGGKGVNLARMTQAGFQVPPGFVVTTDAYSIFMAAGGLEDRVAALTAKLTYDNPAALEQQSAAIREAIMAAPVPASLASARPIATGITMSRSPCMISRGRRTLPIMADVS